VLRVGLDAANRPWAYPDGKGGLTGLDAEVLIAVSGQLGMGLAYFNVAPHLLMQRLAEKQFDLVTAGLAATPELRRQAALSQPYASVGQVVVVPAGDALTSGTEDLAGKRVGAQLGSAALAEARKIAGAAVQPYDDFSIALAALSRAEVEAVIADQILAVDWIRAHPAMRLRLAGRPFAVEPVVFALRSDDAALLTRINSALEQLRLAGTLAQIHARWLQ
jgi:polar amino acid transport system substrate-binding protein